MMIRVRRDVLAGMLRKHGEHDLADHVASVSDEDLRRIGKLGAFYAWSEDAFALGFGMGGTRALALASIDVLENNGRELCRHHTDHEVALGLSETPDADERERELELRRKAAEQHLHVSKS
jgi:hypothetical protein